MVGSAVGIMVNEGIAMVDYFSAVEKVLEKITTKLSV